MRYLFILTAIAALSCSDHACDKSYLNRQEIISLKTDVQTLQNKFDSLTSVLQLHKPPVSTKKSKKVKSKSVADKNFLNNTNRSAKSSSNYTWKSTSTSSTPSYKKTNQAESYKIRIGAICCDGSRSYATGRGACSHHGGVCKWLY